MTQYSVGLQVGITFACIGGFIGILLLGAWILFWLAGKVERECNFGPQLTDEYIQRGWARPVTVGPRIIRPGYWVPVDGDADDMDEDRAAGAPGAPVASEKGVASGSGSGGHGEGEGEGAPLGERLTSDTLHEGRGGETVIHMR